MRESLTPAEKCEQAPFRNSKEHAARLRPSHKPPFPPPPPSLSSSFSSLFLTFSERMISALRPYLLSISLYRPLFAISRTLIHPPQVLHPIRFPPLRSFRIMSSNESATKRSKVDGQGKSITSPSRRMRFGEGRTDVVLRLEGRFCMREGAVARARWKRRLLSLCTSARAKLERVPKKFGKKGSHRKKELPSSSAITISHPHHTLSYKTCGSPRSPR